MKNAYTYIQTLELYLSNLFILQKFKKTKLILFIYIIELHENKNYMDFVYRR